MNFRSIFIANLSEVARPLARLMRRRRRREEIWEDHALCDRFIFSDTDNRLLITPFSIDTGLQADARRLLEFQNVLNLSPRKIGESLCESILAERRLLKVIVGTIRANGGIRLVSYGPTPEFLVLVKYLRKKGLEFRTPEVPDEVDYWTADFFDTKSGFRQVADRLGRDLPSMPEGVVAQGFEDVLGWLQYFLEKKGTNCVLKTNRGLAGSGLKIIRRDLIGLNPGTGFNPKEAIRTHLERIFAEADYWSAEPTVIEEYIEPDTRICGGAPNVELQIRDGKVEPLYVCGMRVTREGVFRGVEMGRAAVPEVLAKVLISYGTKFGQFLRRFGYRGFYETDFVFGRDKKLYPIEANLRRTGGTHVYEMGSRLLGPNFLNQYYVVANNIQKAPAFKGRGYGQVRESMRDLLYPINGKKEGVILTIAGLLKRGELGYLVIGGNRLRTQQIEKQFWKRLN